MTADKDRQDQSADADQPEEGSVSGRMIDSVRADLAVIDERVFSHPGGHPLDEQLADIRNAVDNILGLSRG